LVFDDRVAVVTGGTGALGSAVCHAFARAGAAVVAVARSAAEAPEPGVEVEPADLLDEASTLALADRVRARHGRCDALVCTAGGFAAGTPIAEAGLADWQQQLDLNATTAFLACRAFLPLMLERGEGSIVLVSSRAARRPFATGVPYAVSKAAVIAFGEALAVEVRDQGVRVNVVLPSVIDTPANRAAGGDPSKWVSPASLAATILTLCAEVTQDVSGAVVPVYGRA
jgi:NAD(P)-dependent dehydrogenase (short-subunit alcohol dehydrogenase family)